MILKAGNFCLEKLAWLVGFIDLLHSVVLVEILSFCFVIKWNFLKFFEKKKGRTEGRWLEEEDEKKYRHFLIPTFVCSDSQSKQIDYPKFCHWGQRFNFLLIQTVPIWVLVSNQNHKITFY